MFIMERVADYIIRKINKAGAGHIFLISGRGILYLTDAVARNKEMVPVCTFHEQGASYAAMAYASQSNGIGACLVSTGCAAANAVTACLCAYQDNIPVIFISGNNQLNENTRHTGAAIRTYGSQEADIVSVVEPVTKYAVMLEDSKRTVYEVEKALYLAQEGRKGPVWIDIPLDVQNMKIEENEQEHFKAPETVYDIDEEVSKAAEKFNIAKRPVILAGGGSREAREYIKELAESYNIPIVCSPSASDIYGTANVFSIGTVGSLGGSRAGNFAVQNSDFVLSIASKLCSQLTGVKENFARDAEIVAVDIDPNEHAKAGAADHVIVCGAKEFCSKLLKSNLEQHDESWVQKCIHWKKIFSIKNEQFIKELKENNQIDLYLLLDELNSVLPGNATVITDAGLEELTVPSAIHYRDGQRCLFPASQGAMGYAVPAIIGAYEAGAENIVCIVGDGSIMMNMQELQIVSSLKIPVKILVINNNMYAVIRKRQRDLFRKRTIGNDPSDGVPRPDFRKIADCFGFNYRLIINYNEYMSCLPGLFDEKAEIVEIICTPEQKYFHESYGLNEKRKLVHRPIEDMSPFIQRDVIRNEMIIDMLEE